MKIHERVTIVGAAALLAAIISSAAGAHGDVAPQPVDTTHLPQIGAEWVDENPYRDNEAAVTTGASAYNQNCARCHGLGAVSGGIAPDLRELPDDLEGDEWYAYRVRNGAIRNGITYMPVFAESDGGPLSQEALWAIRAWLVTLDGAE
ncbi:MAG: cytochrome c-550 PedF [Gammaproteobacteria bacterium]